jgi:hypothetical protein
MTIPNLELSKRLWSGLKSFELATEHQFWEAVVVKFDVVDVCFGKIELHDRTQFICPRRS